jgi:hypothetical protein
MKISQRRLAILGIIAILVIIFLTIITAPTNNKNNSGSTYSRAPDGYGAWYAFMEEQGTPAKRWQKPFTHLTKSDSQSSQITLLRIYSNLRTQDYHDNLEEKKWLEKGNTLVILGNYQPVTQAEFTTFQDAKEGTIKIETRRRKNLSNISTEKIWLQDKFGAIVWSEKIGKGQVIFSSTPYLAANAYQDFPANYEFLRQLVIQTNTSIWVDEYIHGYKDTEVIAQEVGENIFSYLSKTPVKIVFIQGIIILIISVWAGNRRFGQEITLSPPKVNNSQAYIEALAAVLRKAEQREFLIQMLNVEEQQHLQRRLGLGKIPLESHSLAIAWGKQTGQAAKELETLLKKTSENRRLSDAELLSWLEKWHNIRNQLDE